MTKNSEKNILVIMGNGPSLKGVDFTLFQQCDTFGLNSAYRTYDKLDFYPTYFGCFDFVVCNHHKDNFAKLVLNS
ncbi:unnamed protein product, partial [marine sediment metagenome]